MLTDAYLVRQLPPWHENISKRQVKAPKVYVRDSGILHRLLDLERFPSLVSHPKCGASFEGLVIDHILRLVGDRMAHFWATHSGAELDLLILRGSERHGFEVKWSDAPSLTKSMRIARDNLRLTSLAIVYPGDRRIARDETVTIVPLSGLKDYLDEMIK